MKSDTGPKSLRSFGQRGMQWPLSTADVSRLLGVPEHLIRYRLRARSLREHVLPRLRAGRLDWFAASVAELSLAIERTGIPCRFRLDARLLRELDAALEAAASDATN